MSRRPQSGFTMVELVISIIVIGIAAAGITTVIARTLRSSADPMLQHQAIAIAEAYMEEILTKSYTALPGTGSRDQFDDIGDYNFTDTGARDQEGNAVAGLGGYVVTVTVGGQISLDSANARRIDVTVTPPSGPAVTLTSYRTNF